jgi:hypothetical protein
MGKLQNLLGKTFASLTVLERAGSNAKKDAMWKCHCSICNNDGIYIGSNLVKGITQGCRCQTEILNAKAHIKHGKGRCKNGNYCHEYFIWLNMRRRCNSPNHHAYCYYGSRGIKVCERWDNFANFFAEY